MPIYEGFSREDYHTDMVEGLGIDQYADSDPEFSAQMSDALWDGWFADDEELNERYGEGEWSRDDLRQEFYEYGFERGDIDWNQWREMMGY